MKLVEPDYTKNATAPRCWCEVCDVWCMNENAFCQHLSGQKHIEAIYSKEHVNNIASGAIVISNKERNWCDLCKIMWTDKSSLNMHLKGKKHWAAGMGRTGGSVQNRCDICDVWCTNAVHLIGTVKGGSIFSSCMRLMQRGTKENECDPEANESRNIRYDFPIPCSYPRLDSMDFHLLL